MATLPPQGLTSFDPTLEVEVSTLDGEPCANIFYVAINQASYLAENFSSTAAWDKVLLATVTKEQIRTFPIHTRREKLDYLKPKYRNIATITFLSDDDLGWPLPKDQDEFTNLLTDYLPAGFSKQFQYGLGLKWEYRFLIDAIGQVPGISELVFTKYDGTAISEPVYRLGWRRYDQLRRALDNIARRYQRDAHDDKQLLAYTNLLHAAAADRFPLKTKKVRPGAIFELVKLGAERASFSRTDHQAAISLVKADTARIAKTDSSQLMELKTSIEQVTLASLIAKFEDMLSKDLTEQKWQEFFKANPFVLSLAFANPVFLVQDQAYVGGASIRGVGEKIADFLVAQRYTGNLGLIEIKRPKTPLVSAITYRTDLYSPSKDLSSAISQVLDQRFRLQINFSQKAYDSELRDVHPYAIQCIVIVGTSPEDKDKKKSLDLYRNATKDVLVITFDELLDKLKEIHRVFVGDEAKSSGSVETGSDLPF